MSSVKMKTKSAPTEEDDLGGLHKHCLSCYSFKFCSGGEDSCEFNQCLMKCGAVFHSCKAIEHMEICPMIRVPCLNEEFGCTMEMARRNLGVHLMKCPASVVMCMAEWNRWPVYSTERRRHIPFQHRNPYAFKGQLDFDLTLRDQRMLGNLGKISRKTKLTLRNSLTRRYPAVPIPSTIRSRLPEAVENGVETNGSDDLLDVGDDIEFMGVRRNDKALSKQMKQWQDDLDERLKGREKIKPYWEYPELEKGNIHPHCANCFAITCPKTFLDTYEDDLSKFKACEVISCRWKCGVKYHQCKAFEHQMLCTTYEESDDFAWMYRGIKGARKESKAGKEKKIQLKALEGPFVGPSESNITTGNIVKGKFVPDPPPFPPFLLQPCRLDIKLETVTRLQSKPKSMYTFVCAQEFRRDEFCWHSKNIHNDIHGGMNNWIEHRCPMASHGCSFASRRMFPHNQNHTLVYNEAAESFGVKNLSIPKCLMEPPKKHKPKLSDLPIELLIKIFQDLDPFTLCNLAVTSVGMREVCCSMLDEKGCVSLQWERIKEGKQIRWQVAYKRWFFSTALKPIKEWKFGVDQVSNHLKSCPYNIQLKRSRKETFKSANYDRLLQQMIGALRFGSNSRTVN